MTDARTAWHVATAQKLWRHHPSQLAGAAAVVSRINALALYEFCSHIRIFEYGPGPEKSGRFGRVTALTMATGDTQQLQSH